jgi:hypothetical protein
MLGIWLRTTADNKIEAKLARSDDLFCRQNARFGDS